MGFLKGCLKAVGTVALGATTIASKVLEEASDVAGFELGQELFASAKEASKNGILNMWEDGMSVDEDGNTTLRKALDGFDNSTQGAGRKKWQILQSEPPRLPRKTATWRSMSTTWSSTKNTADCVSYYEKR